MKLEKLIRLPLSDIHFACHRLFCFACLYINDILNVFSRITGHEKRVTKSLAEAERRQIGGGFISRVDNLEGYDVQTIYKRSAKKDWQDSNDTQLGLWCELGNGLGIERRKPIV